ncbi:PREDICTED: uncharacterized protein LOC109173469 [Ipomoea nil]|uniref:uncharacterized protein LOC109173469 n=1 Tax=Ipomoea nil TaxID=35883 RepID=UPI000900BFDB|nr:PREDICTED: uncharacterized protein LOC109173469 [Ipomoea nil]
MRKRTNNPRSLQEDIEVQKPYSIPCYTDHPALHKQTNNISMRSHNPHYRGIKKMANKVSNFSHLIQRFTGSCLLQPFQIDDISVSRGGDESEEEKEMDMGDEQDHDEELMSVWDGESGEPRTERVIEMEMIMGEVFDAVLAMKSAYVSLQEAHCPWDPEKMSVADMAVVSELRRLAVLRERFWRSIGGGGRGRWRVGAATLREVVAPYEAAVDDMRRKLKAKEAEIVILKDKFKTVSSYSNGGKKAKSKRKVNCSTQAPQVSMSPAPELFEAATSLVKQASKSFTASLLSLMRSAHWDIAAAVRSIEAAHSTAVAATAADSVVGINHAKFALESYVNRKMFQGFDNETFYMDSRYASLLHPEQHRRDCFAQYRDMKALDPVELLGILPTCSFGNFCFKKFLTMVHPKMEESLFGDMEQRRHVLAGKHPRTPFYNEFLWVAKEVWLLHLLAFSLDPAPSHFEAIRGSKFHSQYMESVAKCSNGIGGRMGMGLVVGFPVTPGFKLANGSVIKARVYLVPANGL